MQERDLITSWCAETSLDWSACSKSNWDFCTDLGNENLLEALDFKRDDSESDEKKEHYKDRTFHSLYKHKDFNVEVVVRHDYSDWKKVWQSISPEFFHKYLWKSNPTLKDGRVQCRQIMEQLLDVYQSRYVEPFKI